MLTLEIVSMMGDHQAFYFIRLLVGIQSYSKLSIVIPSYSKKLL